MRERYLSRVVLAVVGMGLVACGSSSSGDDSGADTSAGSGGIPQTPGSAGQAGAISVGTAGAQTGIGGASSGGASGTGAGGVAGAGAGASSGGAAGAATGVAGSAAGGSAGSAAGGSAGSAAGGSAGHAGTAGSAGATGNAGATGSAGAGTVNNGPCDIWVAPNGVDTNPGSAALPVLTPQHGYDLVCPGVGGAVNGDPCGGTLTTMCLKAGTYKLSTRIEFKKTRMGTANRIITMMADPAATTKPILDFSGQPRLGCGVNPTDKNIYGIDIGGDWYRVKGLEISGANDTGILVQGAHDFVENCAVHDAEDTGVLINSSSGFTGSGSYATITNVDSYHNHDERCGGANADGFGAKKGTGAGNVFDGCRSWDNSDDGYDLYAWTSPVTIKNSWAFNQGATTAGSESNGNGFKMGGGDVSAKHVMSNLFGFDNNGKGGHKADWGFTNNSNPASMTCSGCGAWNNAGGSFQNIGHTGDLNASTVTSAKASAAKRNADGSLPAITTLK